MPSWVQRPPVPPHGYQPTSSANLSCAFMEAPLCRHDWPLVCHSTCSPLLCCEVGAGVRLKF